MSLSAKLDNDFKAALKERDADKLALLRLVRSAIKNLEIARKAPAADEDILSVLQREIKQHQETILGLQKLGREEAVAKQEAEVQWLQFYLPPQLAREDLQALVAKAIAETGAQAMSDMGKIMGVVMPQVKGRATGDAVGELARELLEKK